MPRKNRRKKYRFLVVGEEEDEITGCRMLMLVVETGAGCVATDDGEGIVVVKEDATVGGSTDVRAEATCTGDELASSSTGGGRAEGC